LATPKCTLPSGEKPPRGAFTHELRVKCDGLPVCSGKPASFGSLGERAKLYHLQENRRMLTDAPPRKRNRDAFVDSDRHNILPVPTDDRLRKSAQLIESAVKEGTTRNEATQRVALGD